VDRQRNDHLGWASLWRPFKQRRHILRRCGESNSHANIFTDSNRDCYIDTYSNSYGNCNSDSYGYTHAYGYTHSYSELHAEADSDTEISADAGS